jgi:hypothetical protein
MNENIKWIAGAVAVVGLSIGALIYFARNDKAEPPAAPVTAAPPPKAAPEEPAIKHPLPDSAKAEALPALESSDQPLRNVLVELIGKGPVEQFVIPDDLVRHIVVSIDNLPEPKVAERLRPVRRVPGDFAVGGSEDAPTLDAANYERYASVLQMIRSVDTQTLVATYTRYYPLFQEAYESLGHPPQYFNDRLIEVIDVMLAAPEVPGPIALVQPGVLYEFADPKLESLPAGQKVLIRMGTDNARTVKIKLRALRSELVAQNPRN